MGLPPHRTPPAEYQQRGYITIIRRNWHLLPYEQLLQLLGWDAEKLAFTLREDDFLWIKLGSLKPACSTLRYAEPNEAVVKRCEQIKALVTAQFADQFATPPVPRFDFVRTCPSSAEIAGVAEWQPTTKASRRITRGLRQAGEESDSSTPTAASSATRC